MERLGSLLHFGKGLSRRLHAIPKFTRLKVGDNAGHAAHMVGVSVRDGDHVEPADTTRPQIGRNHFLADIEVGAHVARHAARVHQQGFTLGRDQQQRISLTHIDGRDLEYAGTPLRLRRENHNAQCRSQQPGDSNRRQEAPPREQQRHTDREGRSQRD